MLILLCLALTGRVFSDSDVIQYPVDRLSVSEFVVKPDPVPAAVSDCLVVEFTLSHAAAGAAAVDCALSASGLDADMTRVPDAVLPELFRLLAVVLQDEQQRSFRDYAELPHTVFRASDPSVIHHFTVPGIAPGQILVQTAIAHAFLDKCLAVHLAVWPPQVFISCK